MTTTAIVAGLTVSFAGTTVAAALGVPELKIEGDSKVVFAGYKQTQGPDRVRDGQGQGYTFLANGGIDFKADGKLLNNDAIDYSMVIGFTGDMNPGNVGTQASVRKSYIEISSPYGSFFAGNNESALDMVTAGAANVLGGEGGWNGTFTNIATVSTGVVVGDSVSADPGSATTVIFTTPDEALKGFKFIVGLTPNTAQSGFASPTDNKNQNLNNNFRYMFGEPSVSNLVGNVVGKKIQFDMTNADPANGAYDLNSVSGGFSYTFGEPSTASFEFSAAGVMGKSKWHGDTKAYNSLEDPNTDISDTAALPVINGGLGNAAAGQAYTSKLHDTKAYQIGFNAGYRNFELGVTYTDNRKSRIAKRWDGLGGTYDAGKIVSGALSYTHGDIKVSGGFSEGKRKFGTEKTKSNVTTVAVDYTMTPGWKFSAEYDHATFKTCKRATQIASSTYASSAIQDNKPRMFLVSTTINF